MGKLGVRCVLQMSRKDHLDLHMCPQARSLWELTY